VRRAALLGLCLVAGCASVEPAGPDATALAEMILQARPGRPPVLKDVDCRYIPAEGTEWRCRYREQASSGSWVRLETFVAKGGDGWTLIDGIQRADDLSD